MDFVLSRLNSLKTVGFASNSVSKNISAPSFSGLQKDEYKKTNNSNDLVIYPKDVKKKLSALGISDNDAAYYITEQNNLKLYYKAVSNLEESYKKESVFISADEWVDILDLVTPNNLTKFSKENLEKIRKLDLSAFSMEKELTSKTDLIFFFESPELIEKLLTAIKPYEKIIEFSDITDITNDCAKYLVKISQNKNPKDITIDDYIRMALITEDIKAPYIILNNLDKKGKYERYSYKIKEILHNKNPELDCEKFHSREELAKAIENLGVDKTYSEYMKNRDDISPTEAFKALEAMKTVMDKKGIEPSMWIDSFISSDSYSHITENNLNTLFNMDFSKFSKEFSYWHKLHLLECAQKPESLEQFIKIISPVAENISPLSIYAVEPETVSFVLQTGKSKERTDSFLKLTEIFDGNLQHVADFMQNGPQRADMKKYDKINRALYGKESADKKNALKKFRTETGVSVKMDNNLPLENIEYVREFVNITKASGEKTAPVIFITNILDSSTNGEYHNKNYIIARPVIDTHGKIQEKYFSTLQHENGHYLDYQKTKGKYSDKELKDTKIISKYLGVNAVRNRDEFIANTIQAFGQGQIQKYINSKKEITYRYVLQEKMTNKQKLQTKAELIKILSQYTELQGPQIPIQALAEPSKEYQKEHKDFDFIEIKESEIS